MAKIPYGNRQARVLCNLPHSARLDLLAEGLPIILASALGFWNASTLLEKQEREARVLEGFAEEEASKVLILMDLVRCPERHLARCVGQIVRTFYDHLGRLIYAEAQSWRPENLARLREYVDEARKAHYLEGYAGEYIVPNWNRYSRESAIYADIELHEDGLPQWNDPRSYGTRASSFRPLALSLAEAMQSVGIFDRRGLQAVSDIWGTVDFHNQEYFDDSRRLTRLLFDRLDSEGLVTKTAFEEQAWVLFNHWQMPMYHLNFKELAIPLEDLEEQREAALWSEVGF